MTTAKAARNGTARLKTPTDLGSNATKDISAALNGILADTFALYLKTKNFHWHVSGPHFRDYHLMFDEQADQIFAMTDVLAERVRKIGGTTLRSIGQVAKAQRVLDNDADYVDPQDMLAELRDDNKDLVARMRAAHDVAEEHGDVATTSVLEVFIDEAERRTTDPDVLEDLFKMDHLTTRMRRHAESLIILSGAPPGRSWSAPVKLIDVMRGAVAEVEDYARVTVSTTARTALSGSAVTDVIHLLAELIENATTLSPPFTQVRVSGETVANGFAIEIEDRGLGMTPQRLHELNDRLANPPDINPANTEQLGLFVVGQLARRHGIRVMLRPSPYGGTTAVTPSSGAPGSNR